VRICWVVGSSIPTIGGNVPDVVGRFIDPIAGVCMVARPAMALVGVPRHAARGSATAI
jgi:hypothetical protein